MPTTRQHSPTHSMRLQALVLQNRRPIFHQTPPQKIPTLILSHPNIHSVHFDSLEPAVRLDPPPKGPYHERRVLGFFNGSLCTFSEMGVQSLWNPSTKTHHVLPILQCRG